LEKILKENVSAQRFNEPLHEFIQINPKELFSPHREQCEPRVVRCNPMVDNRRNLRHLRMV
jgi:hypothetical protein